MKKRMIKIATMMATLSIAICAVGCGETNNDKISTEDTIIVTESTEVSENTENIDDTESIEEAGTLTVSEVAYDEIIYGKHIAVLDYVFVYSVPSTIDYELVGSLGEDDIAEIIGECSNEEEQADFYIIQLENGEKGYVRKNHLEIFEWDGVTELDVIGYGTMTQRDMVSSQPSEFEYVEVTDVEEGDKVKILREFNNEYEQLEYYEVRLESGEEGFVHKNRVNIDEWVEKENEE